MPEPKPTTATLRASGRCSSGSAASSTCVASSPETSGLRASSAVSDASVLPLVRSASTPSRLRSTSTVAVLPSRWNTSRRPVVGLRGAGPVDARREHQRVQRGGETDGAQRGGDGDRPRREAPGAPPPRRPREQQQPQRDVGQRRGGQPVLRAQQRQREVHADQHAGDGADGVGAVDPADRALAERSAQQHGGEERQRHAGEHGDRQHDRDGKRAAEQHEHPVAARGRCQHRQVRRQRGKRQGVEGQRAEREGPHQHLHRPQRGQRRGQRVDAPADPEAAERDAEYERRQHQLERVRRRAQDQRQQADPDDLVDERRRPGDRRHREQQAPAGPGDRRQRRRRAGRDGRCLGSGRPAVDDVRADCDREVGETRGEDRAGETERRDQHQPGKQHATDGPEAVDGVEERNALACARRRQAQDPGGHQRKRGAEQRGRRQDQQRREDERGEAQAVGRADAGQQRGVRPRRRVDEDRVKAQREHPDRRLDGGVGQQRPADPLRHGADRERTERHAPDEHDQHDRLRVGGMTEEEPQVGGPDRFVDQPRGARRDEQRGEHGDGKRAVAIHLHRSEWKPRGAGGQAAPATASRHGPNENGRVDRSTRPLNLRCNRQVTSR